MSKTTEEIQALKDNWAKDPIWDIEYTEGFEDHIAELKQYRAEQEAKWKAVSDERIKLSFEHRAGEILEEIGADLEHQLGDAGSAFNWATFVIAREQVKATLLLAEQVKRVADVLEDMDSRDTLAESVRLWSVKE